MAAGLAPAARVAAPNVRVNGAATYSTEPEVAVRPGVLAGRWRAVDDAVAASRRRTQAQAVMHDQARPFGGVVVPADRRAHSVAGPAHPR